MKAPDKTHQEAIAFEGGMIIQTLLKVLRAGQTTTKDDAGTKSEPNLMQEKISETKLKF